MEYRDFVRAYMAQHRPRSLAEARAIMRRAAAEWRRGRRNPEGLADYAALGFGGGLGVMAGLLVGAALVCLVTKPGYHGG